MNFVNLKFEIRIRFKLGLTLNQILIVLKTVLSESTPSLSKVTSELCNKFKSGLEELKDQHYKYHKITEDSQVNLEGIGFLSKTIY